MMQENQAGHSALIYSLAFQSVCKSYGFTTLSRTRPNEFFQRLFVFSLDKRSGERSGSLTLFKTHRNELYLCIERWIPSKRSLVTARVNCRGTWYLRFLCWTSWRVFRYQSRACSPANLPFISIAYPTPRAAARFINHAVTPIIMQITGHALKCNYIAIERDNRGNLIGTFRWLSSTANYRSFFNARTRKSANAGD